MNFFKKVILAVVTTVMFAASAQATIITLNDTTEVGVLDLDETLYSSFVDFYSFSNGSAHTGYEEKSTVVLFLASYNDQLALFTLVNAKGGRNTTRHSLEVDFTSMTDIGSLTIAENTRAERRNDTYTDNGNTWSADLTWAYKYGDGFIFAFDDIDTFALDIAFSNVSGITDYTFLSFDASGVATKIATSSSLNLTAIPEPGMISVFALALLAFASRRRLQTK